jgi:post-segregation antitoxin (ccd killing protein)
MAKSQIAVTVTEELADRARDAVYWTPGLTLSGLVEEALEREIRRRERARGESFPKRKGDLPSGRPIR